MGACLPFSMLSVVFLESIDKSLIPSFIMAHGSLNMHQGPVDEHQALRYSWRTNFGIFPDPFVYYVS